MQQAPVVTQVHPLAYRKEIDGLRAVAVVPVVLFHAGFPAFSGGYVGVDVFFVISGYLITSVILGGMADGTFRLAEFYERRARRIFPALFSVTAVSAVFAWAWLLPRDMADFSQSVLATVTFSSNFLFWKESGYFATASELKPLLHTWSLSVEEQYYLLFPIFLIFTARLRQRWTVGLLGLVFASSLFASAWAAQRPAGEVQVMAFYLLPTRGWELLVGVFLAYWIFRFGSPKGSNALSILGLLLIAIAVGLYGPKTPFPGFYALLPVLGTSLVILFAAPHTVSHMVLGNRFLVFLGLTSYSAYLWHHPLFAFGRIRFGLVDGEPVFVALAIASFILAFGSWKFIESPFRLGGGRVGMSTPIAIGTLGAAAAVLMAIGAAGHFSAGFKQLFLERNYNQDQIRTIQFVLSHTDYVPEEHMVDNGECQFWSPNITKRFTDRFDSCVARYGNAVFVIGDSHALNLFNIVAKAEVSDFVVGLAQGGCRAYDERSYCPYLPFRTFLEARSESVGIVLYHQSGSHFVEDRRGEVDSSLAFSDREPYRFRVDLLQSVATYIDGLAEFTQAIWVGPFVESRVDLRDYDVIVEKLEINPKSLQIFAELDLEAASVAASGIVPYLSLIEAIGITSDFLRVDNCITYRDTDHFSRCGEDIVAKRLASILQELFTDMVP